MKLRQRGISGSGVVRRLVPIGLAFALIAGCAASRAYRLPLQGPEAQQTIGLLARVASARGLEVETNSNWVRIRLDSVTEVSFGFFSSELSGEFSMVITLAAGVRETDRRFVQARMIGKEIWREAIAAAVTGTEGGAQSSAAPNYTAPRGGTEAD